MSDIIQEAKSEIQMNGIIRSICLDYIEHKRYFEIRDMYDDKSRHYHNWYHVLKVAKYIYEHTEAGELRNQLMVTAFLHDAVYVTTSKTNEVDSAMLVDKFDMPDDVKKIISDTILFTKYQRPPQNIHEEIFMKADLHIFEASPSAQMEFEKAIFKEYYWVPIPAYVPARIEILKDLKTRYGCNTDFLVQYLESKKWNIGFYPGTFYPFHKGHKSVLDQAEAMFDKVIIGFGPIGEKTSFKWDTEAYGELNAWVKANYETTELDTLVTKNVAEIRQYADNVTLIRGLRNATDLIYEQDYLQTLLDMDPRIKAAYFMTEPRLAHVSSSLIRGVLKLSPEMAYNYYKI